VRRIIAFMLVAVLALIAGGLASSDNALAHEHRAVGNYGFVVGFLDEPAIAYQPNGLSLEVKLFPNGVPAEGDEAAEAAGQPVEGLDSTLKAEVIVGGGAKKMPLTLEAAFGEPGAYEAHFIPTLPGDYTFHISGKVESKDVDESFTSSPEGFSSVDDAKALEFPDKLPTTAELQASINSLQNKSSGGSDDTARVLGIIGIIAGIVGVAAGGVALASRRS
jgi:hypothetical protein